MRGVYDVRTAIADYLAEAMPVKIAQARAQWNLGSMWLPVPLRYDAYDPLTTNIYPTVGSLVTRSRGFSRIDYNADRNEQYRVQYSTRVFVWVKTPEYIDTNSLVDQPYDSTMKVRDDIVAVLRSTLLDDPSFGTGVPDGPVLEMDEGSINEEYFDAIQQNGQTATWYAGGSIAFDMSSIESQYREPLGSADTITTTVSHLDSTP